MQYPGIFYNQNGISECIFQTNKEQSLDEPIEIVKDRLNPTTNSSTHSKANKFSEETSSVKNITENTTLIRTNEENNQQKITESKTDESSSNHNNDRKETLIVSDPVIKIFEGWRLNKQMKSQVSAKSMPGTTTKGMIDHVKGCLQDTSPPNAIILYHGTNDLKSKSTPE